VARGAGDERCPAEAVDGGNKNGPHIRGIFVYRQGLEREDGEGIRCLLGGGKAVFRKMVELSEGRTYAFLARSYQAYAARLGV
jgi:hypothetical protein